MFLDEASIEVRAGKGGDGSASFRREKYVPKGGPDGGDGGDGGDVYLQVKENIHGLTYAAGVKTFAAENGEPGHGKKLHGKNGQDVTIDVPPGTLVYETQLDGSERLIVDLAEYAATPYRVARGGHGGLGNVHFATASHQAPREFTPGKHGERKTLKLVVQHIADVGLVGLPNVGKSTLLARVSAAKPKVANYPFTTLEPHLGVVEHKGVRFVMADIPGLIAGAAAGKGLGHTFLRHLSRTKLLVHLIDAQSADPMADYQTIRNELETFDAELLARPEIVAISRIDTVDDDRRTELEHDLSDLHPIVFSSQAGSGLDALLDRIIAHLSADRS
ncbi:GTPase ObgE [Candidatus Berkelbacteria bacterium]|nr:GTPase ObgE [Candidatus Berkelbacteria bacterium]